MAGTAAIQNKIIEASQYSAFVEKQNKIRMTNQNINNCEEKINLIHDAIQTEIMKGDLIEIEIQKVYEPRLQYFKEKIAELVCQKLQILLGN